MKANKKDLKTLAIENKQYIGLGLIILIAFSLTIIETGISDLAWIVYVIALVLAAYMPYFFTRLAFDGWTTYKPNWYTPLLMNTIVFTLSIAVLTYYYYYKSWLLLLLYANLLFWAGYYSGRSRRIDKAARFDTAILLILILTVGLSLWALFGIDRIREDLALAMFI
ncbi:hypothetical protein GOV04_04345 [Candidatus Woesearchaeota archaeon]|nr:hypothetical protein [Candidatus Woesearchaeota archaeon]